MEEVLDISVGDPVSLSLLTIGVWNYYFGFCVPSTYRGKFSTGGEDFHLFDPLTNIEQIKENDGRGYRLTKGKRVKVNDKDFGNTWKVEKITPV